MKMLMPLQQLRMFYKTKVIRYSLIGDNPSTNSWNYHFSVVFSPIENQYAESSFSLWVSLSLICCHGKKKYIIAKFCDVSYSEGAWESENLQN